MICLIGSYTVGYIYTYNTELFPSTVRGFSVGLFTFVANASSSMIPFIGQATDSLKIHFLSSFLPFSLLAFGGSFLLPETLNKILLN